MLLEWVWPVPSQSFDGDSDPDLCALQLKQCYMLLSVIVHYYSYHCCCCWWHYDDDDDDDDGDDDSLFPMPR